MIQKLSSLRTAPGPFRRAVIARTTIEAAPDAVWDVLTDFFGDRERNPLLRSVQGRPHVESMLTIQVFSIASSPVRSQAQVTVVKAGRDLRWVGRRIASGLLDEEHRFALRQSGNATVVQHTRQFTGILVPFAGALLAQTEFASPP